jgi:hypothetical protein
MYLIQYVLLFGASVLLSMGAFLGRARGFAGILGIFSWFIVGNASAAVRFWDGAGTSHVVGSTPLVWLCYGVAVMHVVVTLLAIHDVLTEDERVDSSEELADQIDPSRQNSADISGLQSNVDVDKIQP